MCAGVAQLVEQLTCNQQVGGSNPSTSSIFKGRTTVLPLKNNLIFCGGVFPSGQRGQTVNLLSTTSVVRIHPLPPIKQFNLLVGLFYFCNKEMRTTEGGAVEADQKAR